MANNSTVKRIWTQVQQTITGPGYRWVSDTDPMDYFDWGMPYNTKPNDIIQAMLDEGDLIREEEAAC